MLKLNPVCLPIWHERAQYHITLPMAAGVPPPSLQGWIHKVYCLARQGGASPVKQSRVDSLLFNKSINQLKFVFLAAILCNKRGSCATLPPLMNRLGPMKTGPDSVGAPHKQSLCVHFYFNLNAANSSLI